MKSKKSKKKRQSTAPTPISVIDEQGSAFFKQMSVLSNQTQGSFVCLVDEVISSHPILDYLKRDFRVRFAPLYKEQGAHLVLPACGTAVFVQEKQSHNFIAYQATIDCAKQTCKRMAQSFAKAYMLIVDDMDLTQLLQLQHAAFIIPCENLQQAHQWHLRMAATPKTKETYNQCANRIAQHPHTLHSVWSAIPSISHELFRHLAPRDLQRLLAGHMSMASCQEEFLWSHQQALTVLTFLQQDTVLNKWE